MPDSYAGLLLFNDSPRPLSPAALACQGYSAVFKMRDSSGMETASNADDRAVLLAHFRESAATASSLRSLQTEIVELIAQRLGHYNWTGFYMLDPKDDQVLVLGPFVGAPTPHVRIPVSQGICGAAVASGETVIVDDGSADPRYLSCSVETQSEIVVPIYARGKVIGEIDIDSHASAAFTRADRAFLEEVAALVGTFVEEHSDA
jgi:L-methionine (R)-S-oxide reductase